MDILKIEFPATKRKDHLKMVLNELNKGFVRGTIDGYDYQIENDDPDSSKDDKIRILIDALQSIKEHLEFKQTLKEKIDKITEVIEETEF